MEGYGLTETSPMITVGSVDFSKRRTGCVGVPLPNVDVRIIDPETKQEMPPNTDGEVRILPFLQSFPILSSHP